MAKILVVDDDPLVCETLSDMVDYLGHEALSAPTRQEGLRLAQSQEVDLVLLDVNLPDGSGLEIIPDLRRLPSCPEIIILTGAGDPQAAELAINSGAWDYLAKPSSLQEMKTPLVQALEYRQERQQCAATTGFDQRDIVGQSPAMLLCLELAAQAAACEANLLLQGETGTGKELMALTVHQNSGRAAGNFVVVDCACLPENLVESLLYGHEKGAFTGAVAAQDGLVSQADGGSLFLDEVGELPLTLQKSFLRALQEKRFRPVGSKREKSSDFRLIAATNRDLEEMVRQGRFREDLLFRLRSFFIDIPPLRQRQGDLPDLARNYLKKFAQRTKQPPKLLSPELVDMLALHDWPGNVRELQNLLDMTLAAARVVSTLLPHHLPAYFRARLASQRLAESQPAAPFSGNQVSEAAAGLSSLKEYRMQAMAEVELAYLRQLRALTKGDLAASCQVAGLSRSQLYSLIKKYALPGFKTA
ncbi:MAG: sigma-54 dependent transcriptional regulator [Pseudomonadota bacterium]